MRNGMHLFLLLETTNPLPDNCSVFGKGGMLIDFRALQGGDAGGEYNGDPISELLMSNNQYPKLCMRDN